MHDRTQHPEEPAGAEAAARPSRGRHRLEGPTDLPSRVSAAETREDASPEEPAGDEQPPGAEQPPGTGGFREIRHRNDPEVMKRLLATPGRWAVVGLSDNPARTAHSIASYVQDLGHEIVPVHPKAETVHGAQGYRTLAEVPGPIDVVDVFVRSELAGGIVDEAIAAGARAVWLQLGVVDDDAAQRATEAGLDVVMDTCPAIEAPRLGVA